MAKTALDVGTTRPHGAMHVLDEAFHLVRMHPRALAVYMFGTMPFWLALLYFWSDMSRSAFAAERCVAESLLLACLFGVMKVCQSRYMTTLSGIVAADHVPLWTVRHWLSVAATQLIIQSSSLVLLPTAALMLFPLPWCLAFYQNALLFGNGGKSSLSEVLGVSWQQARLWPRQNTSAVYVLKAFALVVYLQLVLGMVFLPQLLRMFTGIETVFTLSGIRFLNSTVLAAALALCYLVVDPLIKAFYVLRCFYGESLQSGDDLRITLRRKATATARRTAVTALAMALLPLTCLAVPPPTTRADVYLPIPAEKWTQTQFHERHSLRETAFLHATTSPGTAVSTTPSKAPARAADTESVDPAALEQAVRGTIDDPRYAWRMPREKPPEEDVSEGPIGRFIAGVQDVVNDVIEWFWGLVRNVLRWLRRVFDRADTAPPITAEPRSWRWLPKALLLGGLLLVVIVTVWAGWRLWRDRQEEGEAAVEAEAVSVPDLTDAETTAADLPTEDWLRMARELVNEGNFRLGLRAAYLSALSLLADHDVLTIARHKSNLDYRRELARRAHQLPEVVDSFDRSALLFDRVWYGTHEISRDAVTDFLARLNQMRSHLET